METNQTVGVIEGPNLNPSPKLRFRSLGTWISDHRKMIESAAFQRAADFALLEYQAQCALAVSENPNLATIAGMKLTGAQEFLQTLRLISEQPRLSARVMPQNLDHKA